MIRENRAALSVWSVTLDREAITAVLGVEPGARRSRGADPALHARWVLDVRDDGTGEDQTGAAALRALVDRILPAADRIARLRGECEFRIRWSGRSDSVQGGFVLPADLLADLGALGVDLYLDAFLAED